MWILNLNFASFYIYMISMNVKLRLLLVLFVCTLLSSCFKDEPLNEECDIEEAFITADVLEDMFFNTTDAHIKVPSDKTEIVFNVRKQTDLTALAPEFVVTSGATIVPASGSVHDFSNGPVEYTVTSQDGAWQRKYLVSFRYVTRTVTDVMNFDFERYALDGTGKYYVWNDLTEDGADANNWATGNPGFRLSMGSAKPEDYPSAPVADGYDGACVKLETRSTGLFGAAVNMRLAAGNLFIGTFDVQSALKDAMKATRFGLPFDRKPLRFSGYYKYKAGEKFQNKAGNIIEGEVDEGHIYSVLYRNHDAQGNAVVLQGDNVLTSPQIVAIADAGKISDISEWTGFDVEYVYYEDVDEELLKNQGYNMAVVFSSSKRGALFEGAIGSTLYIDKVRVECEKIEE